MSDFTALVDLASERVGGRVLIANDEFFAPKENLLKLDPPVWIEDKYTDCGKWMDGWETRRRRIPGFDWCVVQLGIPGVLRGVVVDTSHFRGNYPEHCSLEACALEPDATMEELESSAAEWAEILPKSALQGDTQNRFAIGDPHRYTHLRFNIYPDGGVARLRVHGEAAPDWKQVLSQGACIDLASIAHGGRVLDASDLFFGSPQDLLMPGRSLHMEDGWETRRRRGPGHDWVVVQLGIEGVLRQVEVDTSHFKGNFPESCSLEAAGDSTAVEWKEILPRTALRADSVHHFEIIGNTAATKVRFNIYPDGGVARLRIYGVPTREGRIAAGLCWLNSVPEKAARALLLECCGSSAWAQRVAAGRRPFHDAEQLFAAADTAWKKLLKDDWLEAFHHHPKIGERKAGPPSQAGRWSEQEQRSVGDSAPELLQEIARLNQIYESRFGYIFIVCATGKRTEEMLALLKQRLQNDPESEWRIAAGEQAKITRLRLEKLLEL